MPFRLLVHLLQIAAISTPLLGLAGCGGDLHEKTIEGTLTMGPAKSWTQLEIRSEKISSDRQKYTKMINPGRKLVRIDVDGGDASITIMTAGRVPIAKFAFPGKNVDLKTNTFFARSSELNQQYDIGGGFVRRILRREYVSHAKKAETCVVRKCFKDFDRTKKKWLDRDCPGVRGELWYTEDFRNDYDVDFTILDRKDPANLVARFTGQGAEETSGEDVGFLGDCQPRLRIYDDQGHLDLARTTQAWKEMIR